jgi:hypothetical protein
VCRQRAEAGCLVLVCLQKLAVACLQKVAVG